MTNVSDVHGRHVVTPWKILERFLLCGDMGPVYRANDVFAEFRPEIVCSVKSIFENFPVQSMEVVDEVIQKGKAPKNPPVLLALAAALKYHPIRAHVETCISRVIRTATDQFVFVKMMKAVGLGGGRAFKRNASTLYRDRDCLASRENLALQFAKYRNRAGWTHRDLLRVSHYKPSKHNGDIFSWAMGKVDASGLDLPSKTLEGFEAAQAVKTVAEAVQVIREYPNTPWEFFPTEVLSSREVWASLMENLNGNALIRNLGRMSSLGLNSLLCDHLPRICRAAERLHPVSALSALRVYGMGRGVKGDLRWAADRKVIDTLHEGFELSFGNLRKSDAKVFFALDVSGSMGSPSPVAGLSCREVAAAMLLVALRQQPYVVYGFSSGIIPLDIRDDWKLDRVINYVSQMPFSSTDCSLPMAKAYSMGLEGVDLFAIYTDNDTNSGKNAKVSLDAYRGKFNPDAKLATVGISSSGFSIADPSDSGMLDVVGFDPSVPELLLSFAESK